MEMKAPTYEEVRVKLLSLIDGSGSRDDIEDWAWAIVCMSKPPEMRRNVWEAIKALSDCAARDDGPTSDYFYDRSSFIDWLAELDTGNV